MIKKGRQDLKTNRQIIRQIRVDDRSKSIGERDVIRLRSPTEVKRVFRRMLTSADLAIEVRKEETWLSGPGFKSRSGDLLDLFSVVPSSNPRPCL